VTTRRSWISGASGGVTIRGFTMKYAPTGTKSGAILNNDFDYWTIRSSDLSYAHGSNMHLVNAVGLRVVNSDVNHGGRAGINCANGADLEAVDNEIHHNNIEDFDPGDAGGLHCSGVSRLVADGNEVYEND
jgi:hypothetical protein